MTLRARITMAFASLLLASMFVAPLWTITLEAPQYPEGLGLRIMLTDIQGQKQHDLTNINNLNHYIGMKRIEPDAIPELRIMPWIVAALMALGLVVAVSGSRTLLWIWCVLFLLVAIAGLVDFWMWAYDYGHNLDTEHAAIKVPGMSYQPPIIGSKQLLNFKAHSWPALGGWAAFASMALGWMLALRPFGRLRSSSAAASLACCLLVGCADGPAPMHYGSDQDDYCRMTISDPQFATQLRTVSGRVYRFDSIECLRGFLDSNTIPQSEVAQVWVSDAANPGSMIPAEAAVLVSSSQVRSPMGGGLIAFGSAEAAETYAENLQARVLTWIEINESAATESHAHPH